MVDSASLLPPWCVCVCVCVCEGGREGGREGERERERERERQRERERERERRSLQPAAPRGVCVREIPPAFCPPVMREREREIPPAGSHRGERERGGRGRDTEIERVGEREAEGERERDPASLLHPVSLLHSPFALALDLALSNLPSIAISPFLLRCMCARARALMGVRGRAGAGADVRVRECAGEDAHGWVGARAHARARAHQIPPSHDLGLVILGRITGVRREGGREGGGGEEGREGGMDGWREGRER